jgi:hypothetical protein
MASLNKQQKRAKRAKTKAKQLRMGTRKPLGLNDDPADIGEQIPKDILEMFCLMKDAEETSRVEMLIGMLHSLSKIIENQPELLDMENAENEAMAATHLAADLLIDYRMWADGIDREQAQRWLEDPEVIADFGTALDSYKKALDVLLESDE